MPSCRTSTKQAPVGTEVGSQFVVETSRRQWPRVPTPSEGQSSLQRRPRCTAGSTAVSR